MEWNDLKNKLGKVGAPDMRLGSADSAAGCGGDDLISRLRARDAEEAARLKQARILFCVAAGFMAFAFLGIASIPSQPLYAPRVLHQGVLLAAFVYIARALRRKLRNLAKVDYAQPVRSFLEQAEHRYIFMRPADYVVTLLGLLLLGLGSAPYVVGLLLRRYIGPEQYLAAVVLYGLFYVLVCAMGLWFARRDWERDKLPLLADIRRMKDALKEEPADEAS